MGLRILIVFSMAWARSTSEAQVQSSKRTANSVVQIKGSERLRYTVRIALNPLGHPASLLPGCRPSLPPGDVDQGGTSHRQPTHHQLGES